MASGQWSTAASLQGHLRQPGEHTLEAAQRNDTRLGMTLVWGIVNLLWETLLKGRMVKLQLCGVTCHIVLAAQQRQHLDSRTSAAQLLHIAAGDASRHCIECVGCCCMLISCCRRTLRRTIKKTAMLWIRVTPNVPVTSKPAEVRLIVT
jgi:hypothetical protein